MSRPNIVYTSYSRLLLGRYGFLKGSHMLVLVVLSNVSTPCVEIGDHQSPLSLPWHHLILSVPWIMHFSIWIRITRACKAFLSYLKSHIHPSYSIVY